MIDETKRIKRAYEKRSLSGKGFIYSLLNPSSLFTYQQREKAILKTLSSLEIAEPNDKKILDLGCGNGACLRSFIAYGAKPENCYGIDLLPNRVDEARKLSPNIHFQCGNAENLPYQDAYFDLILCFTVFSSIFDKSMKANIAVEMLRVLTSRGIILLYDFHVNNPKNPNVRGVKKKEIIELFQGCKILFKRVTLAPPITKVLAPRSFFFCYILEGLKVLNTHYLAAITKRGVTQSLLNL